MGQEWSIGSFFVSCGMARRPRKVSERRETISIGNISLPTRIIIERGRTNVRASITQHAFIIRLPAGMTERDREKSLRDMTRWAYKLYEDKPETFERFRKAKPAEEYAFDLQGTKYEISLEAHHNRSHRIRRVGDRQLLISVNEEDPRLEQGKLLPKLLAKYFAGQMLPMVDARVRELNDIHFRQPINSVKLSDTYSRWGSCSSKGNINLATRLLLAPPEVMDAVIIHELAHLVVPNHSDKFWTEVERALPNHKDHDKWLKKHGKELLFRPVPIINTRDE